MFNILFILIRLNIWISYTYFTYVLIEFLFKNLYYNAYYNFES